MADGLARLRDAQAQDRLLAGGGDDGGCELSREVRATHDGSCFFRIQFRISISFILFPQAEEAKEAPNRERQQHRSSGIGGEREREWKEK